MANQAQGARTLCLESIAWSGHQLHIGTSLDGVKLPLILWYGFKLSSLHQYYGDEFMERVYFLIAGTHLLKLASLKPDFISVRDTLAKHYTFEFKKMWEEMFENSLGQWRFENDLPNWKGPRFTTEPQQASLSTQIKLKEPQVFNSSGAAVRSIAWCGGGKDGLLAMKLLERAKVPFSSYSFSLSYLGSPEEQIQRAENVLQHCKPIQSHQVISFDPCVEAVMKSLMEELGLKTLIGFGVAEWFAVLPVMLEYGYSDAIVGNEHSANVGNLLWAAEERNINHQWMKSLNAENLINQCFCNLVEGLRYFSILQPIHDVVIFALLSQEAHAVTATHSCNLFPPWCKQCPKCCYVWLSFQAYLPKEIIDPMFDGSNLLEMEENQLYFKQMLGLGDRKPFECVGEIEEAQLAFELCHRKGICGKAMELFKEKIHPTLDVPSLAAKYTTVYKTDHWIPEEVAKCIIPIMEAAALYIHTKLVGKGMDIHTVD